VLYQVSRCRQQSLNWHELLVDAGEVLDSRLSTRLILPCMCGWCPLRLSSWSCRSPQLLCRKTLIIRTWFLCLRRRRRTVTSSLTRHIRSPAYRCTTHGHAFVSTSGLVRRRHRRRPACRRRPLPTTRWATCFAATPTSTSSWICFIVISVVVVVTSCVIRSSESVVIESGGASTTIQTQSRGSACRSRATSTTTTNWYGRVTWQHLWWTRYTGQVSTSTKCRSVRPTYAFIVAFTLGLRCEMFSVDQMQIST